MTETISRVAKAIEATRAELIAQPLARIYEQLAEAAIGAIGGADWQPIETAPIESEIDLWCLNVSDGNEARLPSMRWNDEDGEWEDWHSYRLEPKWRATHWMPPPSPPINK